MFVGLIFQNYIFGDEEMKKNAMKKIIVLLLASILLISNILPASAAYEKGDVNRDGEVSVRDATNIQMFIAKLFDDLGNPMIDINDTEQFYLADMNGDNDISIADATYVQMKVAKML